MAGGITHFPAAEYIPGQLESHVLRRLAGSYINMDVKSATTVAHKRNFKAP